MKVGIDLDGLVANADLIHAALLVDERGAYFAQQDVLAAVTTLNELKEYVAAFSDWCSQNDKTLEEGNKLQAYTVRVMLSHFRIKFDIGMKK